MSKHAASRELLATDIHAAIYYSHAAAGALARGELDAALEYLDLAQDRALQIKESQGQ
jgi:hypothetical protein